MRNQLETVFGPHRAEIKNILKDKKGESILPYARHLAKSYTGDSLDEFRIFAPDLAGLEYAVTQSVVSYDALLPYQTMRSTMQVSEIAITKPSGVPDLGWLGIACYAQC